jgi:hypothetical protein
MHFKLALCVIFIDVTTQIRHISEVVPIKFFPRNKLVDIYSLVAFWIFANSRNKLVDIYSLVWWEQKLRQHTSLFARIMGYTYFFMYLVW